MVLRRISFTIYKNLCMQGQKFIMLQFMIIFFGLMFRIASSFQNPVNVTSMSIFYGYYPPKLLLYYGIMFFSFYCVPIFLCFIVMFWYEMSINQFFVSQSTQWFGQAMVFSWMNALRAHYFTMYDEKDDTGKVTGKDCFRYNNNVCMVVKKYDKHIDKFIKDPVTKQRYRELNNR